MMNRKRSVILLLTGGLVLALGLGAFGLRSVMAQGETPTPEAGEEAAPAQPDAARGERGALKGGPADDDLAAALGITVDELRQAYETAVNEALDQAVADGLITQAQADRLRERFAAGGRIPFGGRLLDESGIDFHALLADALGITEEQLQVAQREAFAARLERAVQSGRLTQEQADLALGRYALSNDEGFQNSLRSAYEAAVQQAVTDGVITQAQADAILAQMDDAGFRDGFFGGRHGFGGRGRRGGSGFAPFPVPDVETPEADGEA